MGTLFAAEHVWTVVVIAGATAALVGAARLRPGPWTLLAARALAVVLVGDEGAWWIYLVATHANRAYLPSKPGRAARLDLLGAWPGYIGWAGLVGIALFLILDIPFVISRKGSADRITGRVPGSLSLVEHLTENQGVASSNLALGTNPF